MFEKGKHVIDKEVMRRNLVKIKEVYDRHYIPFFFIFGTLLGAIRQQDFIDYDNDVDIGAFWEDRDKILEANKEIIKLGFEIDLSVSPYDINYMRGGEKIEIWLFEDLNGMRCYDNQRCPRVKYAPNFFKNFQIINFKGMRIRVPNNPKSFLEVTYGASWVTPNPKGHYIL